MLAIREVVTGKKARHRSIAEIIGSGSPKALDGTPVVSGRVSKARASQKRSRRELKKDEMRKAVLFAFLV